MVKAGLNTPETTPPSPVEISAGRDLVFRRKLSQHRLQRIHRQVARVRRRRRQSAHRAHQLFLASASAPRLFSSRAPAPSAPNRTPSRPRNPWRGNGSPRSGPPCNFQREFQNVAAGRILDARRRVRIGNRPRVARVLKMIENSAGIHVPCQILRADRRLRVLRRVWVGSLLPRLQNLGHEKQVRKQRAQMDGCVQIVDQAASRSQAAPAPVPSPPVRSPRPVSARRRTPHICRRAQAAVSTVSAQLRSRPRIASTARVNCSALFCPRRYPRRSPTHARHRKA